MDRASIAFLRDLNNRFYEGCAQSFSATRSLPWEGWLRCAGHAPASRPLRVLDVACGNMRFEAFLEKEFGDRAPLEFYAVDDCDALAPLREGGAFQKLDIVGLLCDGTSVASSIDSPNCDFVGCFGFMHHIPSFDFRERLLKALIDKAASGGVVCVSFWRFMSDARIASRASRDLSDFGVQGSPALEENDFFLGWKNEPGLARYCHHFDEEEVNRLIEAACSDSRATLADEFFADGKSGELNHYVVLKKS